VELPLPQPLAFEEPRHFSMTSAGALLEAERRLTWHFPNSSREVAVRRLSGLLRPGEVSEMLSELPDEFETGEDSVDQLPSYEHYVEHHSGGESRISGSPRLVALTRRILDERLLPYVRERYDCPKCRVCTSLVRRYMSGERLRHPPHYDNQALVTAVVSISAEGAYQGGLYVRTHPGTEQFVPLGTGEAVIHQHDLEHGVWVQKGSRRSWIVWFQDSPHCIGTNPSWHQAGADFGDPISQYHLSTLYGEGRGGVDEDKFAAAVLLKKSAEQGYARAQHKFGNAYFSGHGVPEDDEKALFWYTAAAVQKSSFSAYTVGRMLESSIGAQRNDVAIAHWYRLAAADSYEQLPDAGDRLATLLWAGGKGVPKDEAAALRFWGLAAEQGHAAAASSLQKFR